MSLFQLGQFVSAAGLVLDWKIECDRLVDSDWECLAALIAERSEPFHKVLGVPTGGLLLSQALQEYVKPYPPTGQIPSRRFPFCILIVDDVLTTGKSISKVYDDLSKTYPPVGSKLHPNVDIKGFVAFDRSSGHLPKWCRGLWHLDF